MIQVCVPANTLDSDVLRAVFINARTCRVQRIVVRDAELAVPTVDGDTQPQLVGPDERKHIVVGDGILIPDD